MRWPPPARRPASASGCTSASPSRRGPTPERGWRREGPASATSEKSGKHPAPNRRTERAPRPPCPVLRHTGYMRHSRRAGKVGRPDGTRSRSRMPPGARGL
eukprot:scaffold17869_cov104-Isochrysis_galbana.AAC.10